MAIIAAMSPVRKTIEALTPTKIAREMGVPISTVHRWMTEDRIPGRGASHEWRAAQFEAAAARLRAQTAADRKRPQRKRAA